MTIIDVRNPDEYISGHVEQAINIPLSILPDKLDEIKAYRSPIILCCASGNRSGQATAFLQKNGIDCTNGGSWKDVVHSIQNK